MTDHFALLDQPRRPWLDADALKARFLDLSATVHPDRVHGEPDAQRQAATERYVELNAAYQCLREPRDRLLHLLELEIGRKPRDIQRLPPGTMDFFAEVGRLCRAVDAFLAERAKAMSPLLKVSLFERAQEWTEKLAGLRQRIVSRRGELLDEVKSLNAVWDAAPAIGSAPRAASLPLERLEQIYRVLSYAARWSEQLQERIVQLSF